LLVPKKSIARRLPGLEALIYEVRGQKVILDADLARIYGVSTKVFNQAVKRNAEKFPADFMFRLTAEEARELQRSRSQNVTLKRGQNIKYLPYAFTEHGAIIAANVGHSRSRSRASYPSCGTAYPRGSHSRVFSTARTLCK